MTYKILILLLSVQIVFSCKSEKSTTASAPVSSTNSAIGQNEESDMVPKKQMAENKRKDESPGQSSKNLSSDDNIRLEPTIDPNTFESKERLLEYHISVVYKTKNFQESRKSLIQTVKQYGIIRSSSSSNNAKQGVYMNVEILVRTDKVYEVLLDLDKAGDLVSESIRSNDLTETKIKNQIRLDRESLREKRREAGVKSSDAKNWKEREDKLSESEDKIDNTKMEEWRLKDRITWAKLHIVLNGPVPEPEIAIPSFRNSLVYGINILMYAFYVLLFLIPFIGIGWGIYYWRKKGQ